MPPPRPAADTRKPYSGPTRSLVIAIDIGTTFSGVSYAILEPGEIPKIHGVTRFPGQEHVAGNTKIPSVIYYDRHGKMMAAGAEADTNGIQAQAEDENWIRAELFKLRLRPRTMRLNMNGMRLGPLPKRKTAVHVFGDFLAYLYRCTRNFITDTHANGASLWNQVEGDLQFVLSHPNGWEGAQQSKMRRAAIYGGLIPETNEGKARIRFVTEGEASLHACVLNGLAADVLSNPSKHGFLIADAGGGTLDISAYAIKGASPLVIEEIAPPDCIFAGSVFVSRRAREFLEGKLGNSKYGTPDALDHITRRFDETTKRLFRNSRDLQFIPFGSPLDKDASVGIRGGQLKLTGQEVADLFEPSVDAAFRAIKAQIEASQGMIRSVFLVGGYAASPWLFSQLQERLAPFKVVVSRPDTQTSKAVADGAIGFYCDHHVSARMSKFMYGVEFLREMDPRDPDHVARKERLCELPSGPKLLPDAFDCILARGVRVKESTVFTRKYCTELTSLSMLSVFEVEIWCYRGGNTIPKWINRQAEDFSTLCVVRADLSPLSGSAEPKAGRNNKTYWTIVFSVEIQFGLTEFRARIKWVDNGVTKYGPASIIYNERGHRADEDEPDVFPEDEANTASASTTPRSATGERLRSEPVSRARTPVAERQSSIPTSTTSSRRPSQSYPRSEISYASGTGTGAIPEVARLDRERSVSSRTSVASASKSGYAPSERGSERNGGGTESDRRTVSSSKSKDRDRERSVQATPRSAKIGDTLASVWGPGGSQSNAASPAQPPAAEFMGGATTRGSSMYGDRPKSPWVDQQQPQTPSHHSTRSVASTHHSQQKSPWVETISTTIENPKNHSPWDTIPSSIPKSISGTPSSIHSSIPGRERSDTDKNRMSSLWEDAPRSSYGDPPKTPWGGNLKTPGHTAREIGPGGGDESTVLLATTPGAAGAPVDLPSQQGPSLSRSVSISGKSPAVSGRGIPVDVDDAPGLGTPGGWGGVTPRSIGGGSGPWDSGAPGGDTGVPTPATPLTSTLKTPKSALSGMSRKSSVAASTLSSAKIGSASPARSPFGSLGGGGNGGDLPSAASPNLLAGAPGIGGHGHGMGQTSPSKQPLSPLNPAARDVGAMTPGAGAGSTGDAFNWESGAGAGDTWNTDAGNNGADSWSLNNESAQPQYTTGAGDSWGLDTTASPAHVPAPIETQVQTPKTPGLKTPKTPGLKTPGLKTPKSIGGKTPKTPAVDIKTPIAESIASPAVETPTTPTPETAGKKKKSKKTSAAASLAAEEEERKRKEKEAEEAEAERKRFEDEQARLAKEAEEAAEQARLAKEAEEAAERQRIAEEEAERHRLAEAEAEAAAAAAAAAAEKAAKEEEEERLAGLEAVRVAKEKEEQERKDKEAKAAAAALADTPGKASKKGKKKRGATLNSWGDEEEEDKQRQAREAKEAEDRAAAEQEAKEKVEREAREKAEQEAKEKAEQEAKEKAEQEAREKAEQEAKEKAEQEAKNKAEEERLEAEAKKAEEARVQAEQDAFGSATTKKGKKGRKSTLMDLKSDTEKAQEEEHLATAKAEQEAKEREEREKAEKQREEEERKEKEEREAKEKAGTEEGGGSIFGSLGGGGWGSSSGAGGWGLGSWGTKVKSKTPSIASNIGGWGSTGPSFGGSFGGVFGLGDSEQKQEEFKLDNVGEQSNGLFDNIGISSASPQLADTLDVPASSTELPDEPPKLPSKTPSRVPSRQPSRAPSPVPPVVDANTPDPNDGSTAPAAEAVVEPATEAPAAEIPAGEEPPNAAQSNEPSAANAEEEWGLPVKTKKKKGAKGKGKK